MLTTRQRIAQERREARDQERYERAMEQERRRCAKFPGGLCPSGKKPERKGSGPDRRLDGAVAYIRRMGGLRPDGWVAGQLRQLWGRDQAERLPHGLIRRDSRNTDRDVASALAADGYFGWDQTGYSGVDSPELLDQITEDISSEHGSLSVFHWFFQ